MKRTDNFSSSVPDGKKSAKKYSKKYLGVVGIVGVLGVAAVMLDRPSLTAPAFAETAPIHQGFAPSFADLVEKLTPAVVSIRVEREVEMAGAQVPRFDIPPGSPLERFFRDFQARPGAPDSGQPARQHGMVQGSGFIISPDGYVVTNNHVVEQGSKIIVQIKEGRDFRDLDAKLIGRDPKTDLALLKVSAGGDLPYVAFSLQDNLRVGDWVIAVGNPFGLGGTVTTGIVSARGRDIGAGPYDDFIQIDASINRGNSGGPTFDVNGNVVGVNTAIFSPNGGSIGIGFAIPATVASHVVDQLKEHGKVDRGWLGVTIQNLDPDLAESLQLDGAKGALVAELTPGGPAEKAGLVPGDVIIKIDGAAIAEPRDVSRRIAGMKPGETIQLGIWRAGQAQTIQVAVGLFPDDVDMAAAPAAETGEGELGLALAATKDGVLIERVDPSSEAAAKGVRPGEIIVEVGGRSVQTPAEVVKGVQQARAEHRMSVLFLLRNDGSQRFVALALKDA